MPVAVSAGAVSVALAIFALALHPALVSHSSSSIGSIGSSIGSSRNHPFVRVQLIEPRSVGR